MKINCLGGIYLDPVDTEECLACSKKNFPAPCGFTWPVLYTLYKNAQDRSEEVHVTDLTWCLLMAYEEKKNKKPHNLSDLVKMATGTAWHKMIADALPENTEFALDVEGVKGTADCYIDGILIDFKVTSFLSWGKTLPKGYSNQINSYGAMMMMKPETMAIQYIDSYGGVRNNPPAVTLVVPDNGMTLDELVQRGKTLADALETNTPPQPEFGSQCKWCKHLCHVGELYLEGGEE